MTPNWVNNQKKDPAEGGIVVSGDLKNPDPVGKKKKPKKDYSGYGIGRW